MVNFILNILIFQKIFVPLQRFSDIQIFRYAEVCYFRRFLPETLHVA